MTYEISRLVQVMPAARLNKEMTANVLFRHQLRNISFRDMDSMVLSVCWFKLSGCVEYGKMKIGGNDRKELDLSKYWTLRPGKRSYLCVRKKEEA